MASTTNDPVASETTQQAANGAPVAAASTQPPANASLYVGDLAVDVTEAMLFEIFNAIGPVSSIRVCRDAVTRRSLGYAYVNFHNPEDCDRAIDELNYSLIKGKQCRIMFSQRDPALRKQGNGNIFIKNLDKTIDSKALYDTFSAFGNILSCKVSMDENGSRGFGFVHYETDEAAQEAIKAVNGMMLNDQTVFVGLHVPRRDRESKEDQMKKNYTNVFIKNLPESVDEEAFKTMCAKYGESISAALAVDSDGKSKCFGFVNYNTHESAEACVKELNDKEMEGKVIYAGRAQSKSEREEELQQKFEAMRLERSQKYQGVNLYVKNLDETIDDERLRQEFAAHGTITSARVMKDEKNASKGFAFVCYTTPEEAAKAVAEMNGKLLGNKPVFVALAQRKEARRAMLEAQFTSRMRQGMMPMYPMYPQGMPPQAGFGYPQGTPMPQGMRPPFNMAAMAARPMGAPVRPGMRPMYPGMPQQQMYPGMPPVQQRPMQPRMPMPQGARPMGVRPQAQPQLTAAMLAKLSPEQQRQVIGDRLYAQIHQKLEKKENVGKITGMLLEMDIAELLHLLESSEELDAKLVEVNEVFEQYQKQQQQQQV